MRGLDTPEIRGKCAAERKLARRAEELMLPRWTVRISRVAADKYAGRHDAEIWTARNQSIGELLIAEGLAREYAGATRVRWRG